MKYSYSYKPPKKSLTQKVDNTVESLIYKIMTNRGLEESVVNAIKQALIELVFQYIVLIALALIGLLALQAIFIAYTLHFFLMPLT